MQAFTKRWHELREQKNSNIVAGLDPAVSEMGRGDKGLSEGADLLAWSLSFVDAVAPYVVMVKINQAYFQAVGHRAVLQKIVDRIHEHGLLAMSDNKIADIGSTNDAWAYYNAELGFDVMTEAPYAGNLLGTTESIHAHGMAAITMGLMSNPEYRDLFRYQDSETGECLWERRVRDALACGVEGIVVGGTYTVADSVYRDFVTMTQASEILYLVPGIGHQGGEVEHFLASGIDPKRCMINSGRAVMFPNGSKSTGEEQAEAARLLRDSFNVIAYAA